MLVEEERKKERKKINKIEIFKFGFLNLLNVCETFGVDIMLEYQTSSLKLFELLCFIFLRVISMPYV